MQSEQKVLDVNDLIQVYQKYLLSKGCKFYPSSNSTQNADTPYPEGQWITGPTYTYVFLYTLYSWPRNVYLSALTALAQALVFPTSITEFMVKNNVVSDGMNYYTSAEILGQSVQSLDFGLVDYHNQYFTSVGTAKAAVQAYFAKLLKPLKGDVSLISDYLLSGMVQFREVSSTVNYNKLQSSCMLLCLVAPQIIFGGNTGIIQFNMIGVFSSQQTRQQVVQAVCSSHEQITWSASFSTGNYVKSGGVFQPHEVKAFILENIKKQSAIQKHK